MISITVVLRRSADQIRRPCGIVGLKAFPANFAPKLCAAFAESVVAEGCVLIFFRYDIEAHKIVSIDQMV